MIKKTFTIMIVIMLLSSQVGSSFASAFAPAANGSALLNPVDDDIQENLASLGITAVSAGDNHTCALTSGGGVKCWGSNLFGQLGYATQAFQNRMPRDVTGLTSGVIAISAGGYHTCALMSGGNVKCWGYNTYGGLGDGTTYSRNTPVDVIGLTGVTALSAGEYHTCAITSGGGVKCWGYNTSGQLGNVTATTYSTKTVDVSGLVTGTIFLDVGSNHNCVITSSGGAKCWGSNIHGQLGNGESGYFTSTVVDVSGLITGTTSLAAGNVHTCAVTTGGAAKCWGNNGYGQLGDGTTSPSNIPVAVSGLTSGIAAMAAGGYHTCALTEGGGVKCWGGNDYSQLGDGTWNPSNVPVNVSGLSSGVTGVTAGYRHTCALMANGGVKCWGSDLYGERGNGINYNGTPIEVLFNAAYIPVLFRNYCADFHDDFSNPSSGWFVGDDNYVRAEYLSGEYRVLVKQAGYLFMFRAPTCPRQNYTVEVDARWEGVPNASYGLIFGIVGSFEQFYSFEINTEYQEFGLFRLTPSGWVFEYPIRYNSAIHPGNLTNHLEVKRDGYWIDLKVNDVFLASVYSSAITGMTRVGLIVSSYNDLPNADARFDNFSVESYPPMSMPSTDLGDVLSPSQLGEVETLGAPINLDLYKQLEKQGDWGK